MFFSSLASEMVSEYEILPVLNQLVSFWLPLCWLCCQQDRGVKTKQCLLCHSSSWKTISLLSFPEKLSGSASLRKLCCSPHAILFSHPFSV